MKKLTKLFGIIAFIAIIGFGMIACDNGTGDNGGTQTQTVATPTASPSAGQVTLGTPVSLSTTTEGASIYYTVDGSTPTTSSTLYSSPIPIETALTIQAIAVKEGMNNSGMLTAAYTVTLEGATVITFHRNAGLVGESERAVQGVLPSTQVQLRTNTFTRNGYVFTGWAITQGGNALYADGDTFTIGTADSDLFAVWRLAKISFNTNGGGTIADIDANANGTITKPSDPTLAAGKCYFDDWYKEVGLTNKWNFETDIHIGLVSGGDITLYAKWIDHDYSAWELNTTPPTILARGIDTGKCSVCDHIGTTTREGAAQLPITDTTTFATVVSGLTANTATTPQFLIVNISDVGVLDNPGSIGNTLINNPTKFVSLDMSGSTFNNIPAFAFYSNPGMSPRIGTSNLINMILPNTVTIINSDAFRECTNLSSINIPHNVTSVESYAFFNCTNLTTVTIPNDINFGMFAFSQCDTLINITIGSNVTFYNTTSFHSFLTIDGHLSSNFVNNYESGGAGVYTRPNATSWDWTKQ